MSAQPERLSPPLGALRATVPARERRRPRLLLGASLAVALVLAAPLLFLLIEADQAGLGTIAQLIWRPLTAGLLWNTVRLTLVVTALCVVIGTLTAWCVERTDLPARRLWAVLVVVPFAIPDFVVSFGWASISTWMQGFQGAVVVMTLAVYPLVYLPVAASLRSSDPRQEEVARSLGAGPLRTFFQVTLSQARGAILGGCVLVALVLLSEYGAFEILSYQTFTTEIFTEFQVSFNVPAACALSLVLILLGLLVLGGEGLLGGRGGGRREGTATPAPVRRVRLGWTRLPVLLGFTGLVGLALGVPVGASIYWMAEGSRQSLPGGVPLLTATWYTLAYSGCAAALSTLMALPLALLSVRHPRRRVRLLERSTFLVLAMPGLVIALALSFFTERYASGFLYQSAPLLVIAYAILFFPLALVAVTASVARAPQGLEEVALSLGQSRLTALRRVTLPLVGPGLGAAFCLVFLAGVTELTATLILVPTGVQTLATQFWAYQQNLFYGQAAPFALLMIGLAVVPSYLLERYFDRSPARSGRPSPPSPA